MQLTDSLVGARRNTLAGNVILWVAHNSPGGIKRGVGALVGLGVGSLIAFFGYRDRDFVVFHEVSSHFTTEWPVLS
jgi:hypothetical protein